MKEKTLYPIWACLYVLCACLGAISERSAAGQAALTVISLLFFVPGAVILYQAIRREDKRAIRRVRVISIVSLTLTLVALVFNICVAPAGSESLRDLAEVLLCLVSVPMLCGSSYIISLFLWACLLMSSFPAIWQKKTK